MSHRTATPLTPLRGSIPPPALEALILFVVLAACQADKAPADTAPVGPADPNLSANALDLHGFIARNVVIIHVDTLRADALPVYGSEHDTLPLLEARGGWVAVDHAVATSSWTAPTTVSVLTGLDPYQHGVRETDHSTGLLGGVVTGETFPTWIADSGVATGLFTGNQLLVGNGIETGFDDVFLDDNKPGNTEILAGQALSWLDTLPSDQRFVVFLQPMDVHEPFNPSPIDVGTWSTPSLIPFDLRADSIDQEQQWSTALNRATSDADRQAILDQIRDVYDEQFLSVDRSVDGLLAGLQARGRGADTLVVLAADHGESMWEGEPPRVGHGGLLRHELVHVPVLFHAPGLVDELQPCTSSGMDLFPTVLDAMELPQMPNVDGRSMLKGCRDHGFSSLYVDEEGERMAFASIESASTQLIVDCHLSTVSAYDLAADPDTLSPLDLTSTSDGAALLGDLDLQLDAVTAALPTITCPH